MIIAMMALALGAGQTPRTPDFTEADVVAVEACVSRADSKGDCPGAEAATRASITCMTGLPSDASEADLGVCLTTITDRCVGSYASTTSAMNALGIRLCSARSTAGVQAAVADWFERARVRLSAPVYGQYVAVYATAGPRAEEQVAAATETDELSRPLQRTAVRAGVWSSFASFLWQAERNES